MTTPTTGDPRRTNHAIPVSFNGLAAERRDAIVDVKTTIFTDLNECMTVVHLVPGTKDVFGINQAILRCMQDCGLQV